MSMYYELSKRPSQAQSNKCLSHSPGRVSVQNILGFLNRSSTGKKIKKYTDENMKAIYSNPVFSPPRETSKSSPKAVNQSIGSLKRKKIKIPVKLYSVPYAEDQLDSVGMLRNLIKRHHRMNSEGLVYGSSLKSMKINRNEFPKAEKGRVEKIIKNLRTRRKVMKDYESLARQAENLTISGWKTNDNY